MSLILGSAIAAVIAVALATDQRTVRELAEVRAARADLRDAAAVISYELRGSAPRTDTMRLASDTAFDLFAPVLAGIACAVRDSFSIVLAPRRARGGGLQSSVVASPDSSDVAWLWERDTAGRGAWRRYTVASYSEAPRPCDASLALGGGPVLALTGSVSARVGTPVHVVRRGRYSVYRASDARWYLGYRRCDPFGSSCGAIQPVAGPYRSRTGPEWGVHLQYRDSADAPTGDPTRVSSIEIVVRSDTSRRASRTRVIGGLRDSVRVAVTPRN